MQHTARWSWLIGLVLLPIACSSLKINADYPLNYDYSSYRTWAWYPERSVSGDPRIDNPLVHQRVQRAVERTLGSRDYRQVSDGQPDLWVAWHAALEQRMDVRTVDDHYGYGYYPGYRRWSGPRTTTTTVNYYDHGELLIDLVDGVSRQLVWRGSAQARVYSSSSPEQREKRINEAVGKILAQFPPRAGEQH